MPNILLIFIMLGFHAAPPKIHESLKSRVRTGHFMDMTMHIRNYLYHPIPGYIAPINQARILDRPIS
jgi:hypothetical protein